MLHQQTEKISGIFFSPLVPTKLTNCTFGTQTLQGEHSPRARWFSAANLSETESVSSISRSLQSEVKRMLSSRFQGISGDAPGLAKKARPFNSDIQVKMLCADKNHPSNPGAAQQVGYLR